MTSHAHEPTPAAPATVSASAATSASASPVVARIQSTSHTLPPLSHGLAAAASPSPAGSVRSSRESSPHPTQPPQQQQQQQQLRQATATTSSRGLRSRKNSHDQSPSRPTNNVTNFGVPSAAAIQRALSAANTPPLQPTSGPDNIPSNLPKLSRASRSGIASGESTPHWPISPRLKSPPPSNSGSRRNSLRSQTRRPETVPAAPSIVVQQPSPSSSAQSLVAAIIGKGNGDSESEDTAPLTMKTTGRGASGAVHSKLETVAEGSLPTTPGGLGALEPPVRYFNSPEEVPSPEAVAKSLENGSAKVSKQGESESESGGSDGKPKPSKNETDNESTPRPKLLSARNSYTALVPGRSRTGTEASTKNMTVETETVTSIPQAVLGQAPDRISSRSDLTSSLRLKPSTETIRPKKEKKKPARKAPSITQGTASTKADVFERKVADAVDEAANSSDSDETFVYESNPPDPTPRRSRHHSRTPSATSMASLGPDHRRNVATILDTHRVASKRTSMKFTNAYHSADADANDAEANGTIRGGSSRANGGNTIHHHHIGRFGRGGVGHTSLFDNDSLFSANGSSRSVPVRDANSNQQTSRPNSPRFANNNNRNGYATMNKRNGEFAGSYDLDGEGDDERTPLIGTVRRNTRGSLRQRPNTPSLRQFEYYHERQRGWISRCAGCVILIVMMALVVFGAVAFLFATTKPLDMVAIHDIKDVLASEQEIMLDLEVEALNPNVIAVTVWDMDVNVFAKSKHVGSEKWWREHPEEFPAISTSADSSQSTKRERRESTSQALVRKSPDSQPTLHTRDDYYDDPPAYDDPDYPDPSGDAQTMLLGRILRFDSPLIFDGSPLKRHLDTAVGELRLSKPGNKTELGGTERWERVLQHPFELIVRGVLKYQLPLNARMHSAPIGASVIVHPQDGVDENGRMRIEKVRPGWWDEEWKDEDGRDRKQDKDDKKKEEDNGLLHIFRIHRGRNPTALRQT